MKNIIALFVALMMLTLCACGNAPSSATESTDNVDAVTGSTENNTPETDEATQATTVTTIPEETKSAFSPEKLAVWGLPEPSFTYEYLGYRDIMIGLDILPELYYRGSADYTTIRAYAQSLADAGWNDYVDDPGETSIFAFAGEMGDFKIFIRRDPDGNVVIRINDRSVQAVFDDALDLYVVPEYGEYGSYGENDYTLETL